MTKQVVLDFFGGFKKTAYALDVTDAAVRMWPDRLGKHLAARVIIAGIQRKGIDATRRQWPTYFESAVG